MQRLSHRPAGRRAGQTVGEAIEHCAAALLAAGVHFGHGTDNARDEAAEIVFFAAGIAHARGARAYAHVLLPAARRRIARLLRRRIVERLPLPYLTHRAFFAGLELYVDRRVLVPRSPIAELVAQRFAPWIDPRRVRRILDLGTGSGAIALACARAFPRARVDAVDVSADALAVCRRNVRRLGLERRVEALRSDLYQAVEGRRYDIIVSNPPYVGARELRGLPPEYRHEPRIGLAAGADGLALVRRILAGAREHLAEGGILVVEVGNSESALQRAFPRTGFIWPAFTIGGGGVFLLRDQDI
ncbi:MAG: 50S ribosomal protein L3 N(5)-glutamine methyltransferase [Gammaproteobacteria bacterium]|nr:50S ribosomal protein L3 N(5)-glutamine methyltransferase [Gammaproteobacteria bacterium]